MNLITLFQIIILVHIATTIVNFISAMGYPEEDRAFLVGLGAFPVVSQLLMPISIYRILKRFILSKGKCGFSHDYVLQSFEGEPDEPGSFRVYLCQKCGHTTKVSWPTKEEIKEKWGWE